MADCWGLLDVFVVNLRLFVVTQLLQGGGLATEWEGACKTLGGVGAGGGHMENLRNEHKGL